MIEFVLSLLVSFGMAAPLPAQEETVVELDERPTESEMECFVECFHYCIWPSAPRF